MKKLPYISFLLFLIGFSSISMVNAQIDTLNQAAPLKFTIGKSVVSKSLWSQPYRYEDKSLKVLNIQVIISPTNGKNKELDFNSFILLDEENKLRIRPNAVYYLKGEKKMYLKSKAVNENYNAFRETIVEGFQNLEAETYKPNLLGRKKKNTKSSVKALKKITVKDKKITYYIDYPVTVDFTYAKVHYNNKPIGFAAAKN